MTGGDDTPTTDPGRRGIGGRWWIAGLAIAAFVVIVLAPRASSDPDGLERVADDQGFLSQARAAIQSLLPDYQVPGLDGDLSTIVAGLIGVAVVFGAMMLLGRILARRPG